MRASQTASAWIASLLLSAANVPAEAPGLMTVQGRLVDDGQLVDSAGLGLRLAVYDAATDGAPLYTEDDSVVVIDGLYATILGDNRQGGSAATLPEALKTAGTNAWLGVTIIGNPEMAPRRRLLSAPYAMNAVSADALGPMAYRLADAFVVVQTTDNAATNGQNLLSAYTSARNTDPHGAPRSADNRVAVLVPPGQYDLVSGRLLLDTEFVDLVGISSAPENARIFGKTAGPGSGVIRQIANDVHIENLLVKCTRNLGFLSGNSTDPAAYYPNTLLAMTRVRNCRFETTAFGRSTRTHITYSGTYENCHVADYGLGGGGTASGTFRGCTGGNYTFGGLGAAAGVFYDCEMTGTAWNGALSGTMESCRWGAAVTTTGLGKVLRSTVQGTYRNDSSASIGGDLNVDGDLTVDNITAGNLGPLATTRSGAMVLVKTIDNETTNGQNLLAAYTAATGLSPHGMARGGSNRVVVVVPPGRYNLGTGQLNLSQQYIDLVGLSPTREHQYIFGTTSGNNSGVLAQSADDVRIENLFVECTRTSVGNVTLNARDPAAYFPNTAFARTVIRNCRFSATLDANKSWTMRVGVSYAGTYEDVVAGKNSFGYAATASGRFVRCTAGQDSFGSAGTASGTFIDCLGRPYSYGGTRGGTSQATGVFRNCTYQNDDGAAIVFWGGTFSGRMQGCTWKGPLTLANGAVVYDSTIVGDVSGLAGTAGTCKIAHTRAWRINLSPLSNAIGTPGNVVDTDIE